MTLSWLNVTTQAVELYNALNVKNIDILARYARIQRNAAIAAAVIIQGHAQAYHPRHASVTQPAIKESTHHGPRNAQ
jgi:hypothetical protein